MPIETALKSDAHPGEDTDSSNSRERYRIGQRAIFLLVLMSSLWGCSGILGTGKNADYPWTGKKQQILMWAASEKTKVNRGTLDNSKYWEEFYLTSIELRPDLDDFLYFSAEMFKVSRIFEEGKITRQQFEEKSRQLSAIFAREEKRRAQVCSSPSMNPHEYETILFACYRGSLFLGYVNDLRTQLSAAGRQFSVSRCALFGDSIQCATQDPLFFY